jgi:hypothetical protein
MSLTDLASEGKFKTHKTSKAEIDQLLAVFDRDIADAKITDLSTDRRFIMAYGSALSIGIAALSVGIGLSLRDIITGRFNLWLLH